MALLNITACRYGFDILVDQGLHPWLLEVNASPALAADSDVDWVVKEPLLRDLVELLDFPNPLSHDILEDPRRYAPKSGRRNPPRPSSRPDRRRTEGRAGKARGRRRDDKPLSAPSKSECYPPAARDTRDRRPPLESGSAKSDAGVSWDPVMVGGYESLFPFNAKVEALSEQLADACATKRGRFPSQAGPQTGESGVSVRINNPPCKIHAAFI